MKHKLGQRYRSVLSASVGLAAIGVVHAGIVAHYTFDSDYTDSSANADHATLTDVGATGNSGVTNAAGEFVFGGGAMNFSEDRDYLEVTSRTFSTGTAYTFSFWAQKAPGDPAAWDMVLGQRDNTIFFVALNDLSASGALGLRWRSNTGATGTRNVDFASPDDTSWHHHVITADASKNLSYYLDGALVTTESNVETGIIYDTIGEAYTSGRDFDFHGQIDEMWILDEHVDATTVNNLFTANSLTQVPEPSSSSLFALGGTALMIRRRR